MKVVTHSDFHTVYNTDPAAGPGRIESIHSAIEEEVEFVLATPARKECIERVHSRLHINNVAHQGLYDIAALAAGATIQSALIGLSEPCFALVRPPGHHAYPDESFGYCYFNNIAIATEHLKREGLINNALVLDFDLHHGDGTEAILRDKGYALIYNPRSRERRAYLEEVEAALSSSQVDMIGVSAGFDNHLLDWGGLLHTEDYQEIGRIIHTACKRLGIGCFAVLEGGYHNQVLEESVPAFLRGLVGC
jgi:acetoin utilization deacetylase AcuC-like enzyme